MRCSLHHRQPSAPRTALATLSLPLSLNSAQNFFMLFHTSLRNGETENLLAIVKAKRIRPPEVKYICDLAYSLLAFFFPISIFLFLCYFSLFLVFLSQLAIFLLPASFRNPSNSISSFYTAIWLDVEEKKINYSMTFYSTFMEFCKYRYWDETFFFLFCPQIFWSFLRHFLFPRTSDDFSVSRWMRSTFVLFSS